MKTLKSILSVFADYTMRVYPEASPYMQRKVMNSVVIVLFSLAVTIIYLGNLFTMGSQTYENPTIFVVIALLLAINLVLIRFGKPGFVVPTFSLVVIHAQFSFFAKLPIGGDISIVAMLSFCSMMWILISYRWWHIFINILNVMIAISTRARLLFHAHANLEISNDTYISTMNAYFLLICVVCLSILVYYYLDREVRYAENETLATRSRNDLMNELLNAITYNSTGEVKFEFTHIEGYFDTLTGFLSNLAFNKFFPSSIADRIKQNTPFVIAYMDLNKLKQTNDQYSHEMGNKYLVAFSESIKINKRKQDSIYRIGGDEFIILFDDANEEAAEVLLGKAQDFLRDKCLTLGIPGSFAFGFVNHCEAQSRTAQELINLADKRMYQMKYQNGERSEMASDGGN